MRGWHCGCWLWRQTELHDRMANSIHKIGRPNIFENEIFHSSAERALGFMKNYFLYSAREAAEYTTAMSENVCKSMDTFMAQQVSAGCLTAVEKEMGDGFVGNLAGGG